MTAWKEIYPTVVHIDTKNKRPLGILDPFYANGDINQQQFQKKTA